ncbi:hypothetical protein [Sideroxydans sp.]
MKYSEIEKQLDEFLAAPDVLDNQKDWRLAVEYSEKLLAEDEAANNKKSMMRMFAKSLTAYTKCVLMCEAVIAAYKSTETMRDDVKKVAEKTLGDANKVFEGQNKLIGSLLPAASKGVKFTPKRKAGSISKKTKHIRDLAKTHRRLSGKELLGKADKSIIEDMSERTFFNRVAEARKLYPKESKSQK